MIKRIDNKIVPMTIEDKKLPDSGYYIENNKLNDKAKKELDKIRK